LSEIFEYTTPIKRYSQLIFVLGGATIVLGGLILSLPVLVISKPDFQFQQEFIGYFIFFPIFLMYSMWLIVGYEKVIIHEQTIELIKSNRIFTKRKCFLISDIKSIEIVGKKYKSDKWIDVKRERIREKQRAFPFWIRMGKLKLVTKNENITFFNGLSDVNVRIVKDQIVREIEKRKLITKH